MVSTAVGSPQPIVPTKPVVSVSTPGSPEPIAAQRPVVTVGVPLGPEVVVPISPVSPCGIKPQPAPGQNRAPEFITSPGVYITLVEIEFNTPPPGVFYYATTDGSIPTPQNGVLVNNAPLLLIEDAVVQVAAFGGNKTGSLVTVGVFTIIRITLSILPDSGVYLYSNPPFVQMLTDVIGAVIRFTTNGVDPTPSDPVFAPFFPTENIEIKGKAYPAIGAPSEVVSRRYDIKLDSPLVNAGGTFTTERLVSATPAVVGVNQYRVNSGAWVVGDSVLLTQSGSVTFRAVSPNHVTSDEATRVITIKCAAPTISPNGGNFEGTQAVTINTIEPAGTTHYRTDGVTPTQSDPTTSPFNITANAQVRARTFRAGCEPSDVVSANFTLVVSLWYAGVNNATNGRAYQSINLGASFPETQPYGNTNQSFFAATAQRQGNTGYLLASGRGVARTNNAGASYVEIPNPNAGQLFNALAQYTSNSGEIIAAGQFAEGTNANIFRLVPSQDTAIPLIVDGITLARRWNRPAISLNGQRILALADDTATVPVGGLKMSQDGGMTWATFALDGINRNNFVRFATPDLQIIYVVRFNAGGTYIDTWRTLNGGVTWTNAMLPTLTPYQAINDDRSWLYGFSGSTFFRSNDLGATGLTSAPFGSQTIQAVACDKTGQRVLVATSTRLHLSTNFGASFTEIQPAGNVNRSWFALFMQ